ncbi:MAG: bifunctional diguanylate cyclase/phosphodiesterase [Halomonas sp.]|nr:bifunctional diguanylate cyclase/phosphodiesterase [Halomonas sp.]MCC5883854.1 bifunctional diguanylate cyclase/phosphodiesterase [Halomonas sp.]
MRQLVLHGRPHGVVSQVCYDDVTGLVTRRQAEIHLNTLLIEAATRKKRVGVLHVDIDRLKEINHSLGRAMGDACLRQLAQRIVEAIGNRGHVSRMDSDELMVVLPDIENLNDVIPIVENLLAHARRPLKLSGQALLASCCLGVALYPEHGETVSELMRHANLARRKAQARGAGQYCVFSPDQLKAGTDRLQLRCDLHKALPQGEMALQYRPLICARSGQVVAIAAQPRWHSPRFGILEPAKWIPAARDNGLLNDICHWVLINACRHARSWYDAGSGLRVVIGVPAEGVAGDMLIERVEQALDASCLPPDLLEIELTESGLMRDPHHASNMLARLHTMGVRLAIDGFGSGHSILGHLGLFPLDTLKLDALFIHDCLDNPRHQAIIRSVIGMAHDLGIRVAASGVSSRQQVDFLRELGCDLLQGSLWSRMEYSEPLPPLP